MINQYKYLTKVSLLSLFFILCFLIFNFVNAQDATLSSVKSDTWYTKTADSLNIIGSKIWENTPEFITSSIEQSVDLLENFRIENKTLTDIKKEQAKEELELLRRPKAETEPKDDSPKNYTTTFIAYAKLFLFTSLSYVLTSKLLFYSLFAVISFFVIGVIWRKFS